MTTAYLIEALVAVERDQVAEAEEALRRDRPGRHDAPLLDRRLDLTESEIDLALGEPDRVVPRYAVDGLHLTAAKPWSSPASAVCSNQRSCTP